MYSDYRYYCTREYVNLYFHLRDNKKKMLVVYVFQGIAFSCKIQLFYRLRN